MTKIIILSLILVLICFSIPFIMEYIYRMYVNNRINRFKSRLTLGQKIYHLYDKDEFTTPKWEEFTITDIGQHSIRVQTSYGYKVVYELKHIYRHKDWTFSHPSTLDDQRSSYPII